MSSSFLVWCLPFLLLLGCSEKSNKGSPTDSGGGNLNIKVASQTLSLDTVLLTADGCDCSQPGTSRGGSICGSQPDGKCFAPLAVKGYLNQVYAANARIMGGGDKYHGLESVFRTGHFDLANPVYFDGDDNLQDGGGKTDIVDLRVQSIEYSFLAAGRYFHILIPSVSLPVTEDSAFVDCIDEGGLGESVKYINLYDLSETPDFAVVAGDILVCIKTTLDESCKLSDYQWADSSGVLYSTRPTNPLRLTGSYAFEASSCEAGSDHPNVTWGSMSIYAQTATGVDLAATIDKGQKVYTSGGNTGTTLDLTLDIDLANQLYVPNSAVAAFISTDYATSGPTLISNLNQITLRQIYQLNTRASADTNIDSDNMFQASISATISGTPEESDNDVEDLAETHSE